MFGKNFTKQTKNLTSKISTKSTANIIFKVEVLKI